MYTLILYSIYYTVPILLGPSTAATSSSSCLLQLPSSPTLFCRWAPTLVGCNPGLLAPVMAALARDANANSTSVSDDTTAAAAATVAAAKPTTLAGTSLTDMFKRLAVHPVETPRDLLARGRRTREMVPDAWTREVARSFGQALKSAKHNEAMAPAYVEALHPRWNRWRCAKILLQGQGKKI